MLKIINLYVISEIFATAEPKIGASSQMLYINCLIHHFKDKAQTVVSAVSFDIFKNDIKGYAKFERNFEELHNSGLVIICDTTVNFVNTWGKLIDRSQLSKISPDEYVAGFAFEPIDKFVPEMTKSDTLIELCQMKHRVTREQLQKLMSLFIMEQKTVQKTYSGYSDCAKHFINWIPTNIAKIPKQVKQTKFLGED